MYCFVMQPWQTICGDMSISTITQTESSWLDLTPYQDVVAWLEVKETSAGGGGGSVQVAYQTSPTKDDSLFQAVVAAFDVASGVTTTVMLKDSAMVTLSRWFRWQLTVTGSPVSSWDATFRIFIAANLVGTGGRAKVARGAPVARPALPAAPTGVAGLGGSRPLHAQQATSGTSTFGTMLSGPPTSMTAATVPTGGQYGPSQAGGNLVLVPKT
jgi:hypothetical protein